MSGSSVTDATAGEQGPTCDRDPVRRTRNGDLVDLLNRALVISGYTHDALASAMEKDRGYITKVLGGDKPLGASFLMALPDDIGACFARLHAEAYGLVVVRPASGEDAIRQFAAGLIGIFAERSALPAKATALAKAALPPHNRQRKSA